MSELANAAYSTLASGITAGATSLSVASGEGARFPSTNFYICVYDSIYPNYAVAYRNSAGEIMLCSSRTTDALTVTRAQDSTAAVAFNTTGRTYRVELNVIKAILDEKQAAITNSLTVGTSESTAGTVIFKNENDSYTTTLSAPAGLSASNTVTMPGTTGTVCLTNQRIQFMQQGVSGDINATRYTTFGADAVWASDIIQITVPTGVSFTLSNLTLRVNTIAVNAQTTIVTIMKDGIATALTVTVANADKTVAAGGEDTTHSVTFTAGERLSIRIVPEGTSNGISIGCLATY